MPAVWDGKAELVPGLVVADRYRLERPVGQGGMGSVWAASHMLTHRAVALKLLRRSEESEESRLRFLREARAACAVMHPNVVEVLDFLESSGAPPIIVMELLEGESLATLLGRAGKLSVARTAEIMLPVVSAVGTAHAEGIVHRDLKPDNIFLQRERDGSTVVKVLDFGIAKLTVVDADTRRDAGLTHTGAILGTPTYMSPEQVFGETDLDHRADVWALGIILYRCLSGVLPTEAGNVGQVYKIIVSGKIKPLRELAPDVPPELASLIDRMLARERRDRPSDLGPVLSMLQRFADCAAPSFGAPRTRPERAEPEQTGKSGEQETLALTGDAEPPEQAAPRRRWLVPAAAAVAAGLVGATLAASRSLSPEPAAVAAGSEPAAAGQAPASASVSPPGAPAENAEPGPSASSEPQAAPADSKPPRRAKVAPNRPASSAPLPSAALHPEDRYGF